MDLQGRNAIVTGGSIGIGTAIALKLAQAGANVALNYRRHADEANAVVADQNGFTVGPVVEPRVASFAGLDQYGLVYIGTHGNFFKHKGDYYFGLLTSEPRESSQDIRFLADDEFREVSVYLKRDIYIVR